MPIMALEAQKVIAASRGAHFTGQEWTPYIKVGGRKNREHSP